MEVIDKILNEWSFRCHDGIVDLNDPKKVKILFEIIKPTLEVLLPKNQKRNFIKQQN